VTSECPILWPRGGIRKRRRDGVRGAGGGKRAGGVLLKECRKAVREARPKSSQEGNRKRKMEVGQMVRLAGERGDNRVPGPEGGFLYA